MLRVFVHCIEDFCAPLLFPPAHIAHGIHEDGFRCFGLKLFQPFREELRFFKTRDKIESLV